MRDLVLFAFVLTISGQALADWMHPHYSFRCRESENIDIFGIHDDSIMTILNGTCAKETKTPKNGIITISYNCTNETEIQTSKGKEAAYEVLISVKDPTFGETTNSTSDDDTEDSTTEATVVIGGHKEHKFIIRCLNIPTEGINKTVAHVFQGGPHKLPDNHKEVSPVEMHFKAISNIDAPDISEIYIGDEFFMFLKYTGASQYTVIPRLCKAYAGAVVPVHGEPVNNNKVLLWNETETEANCTKHKELLEAIETYKGNENVIAAKMYGFRFETSEYITIACDVGIFRHGYSKGLCGPHRRKRDVVDTAIQRKDIVGKLKILDNPSEYGNTASKSGGSLEWVKLCFGIMILGSHFGVF